MLVVWPIWVPRPWIWAIFLVFTEIARSGNGRVTSIQPFRPVTLEPSPAVSRLRIEANSLSSAPRSTKGRGMSEPELLPVISSFQGTGRHSLGGPPRPCFHERHVRVLHGRSFRRRWDRRPDSHATQFTGQSLRRLSSRSLSRQTGHPRDFRSRSPALGLWVTSSGRSSPERGAQPSLSSCGRSLRAFPSTFHAIARRKGYLKTP